LRHIEPETVYFCKKHDRVMMNWVDHARKYPKCCVFTVYKKTGEYLGLLRIKRRGNKAIEEAISRVSKTVEEYREAKKK